IMGSKQAGDAAYGFIAEAMTWTGVVLMTGWLEKFPRLKVAILESNSSWLPLVLEKAETYLELYRHTGEKIGDPHEVFYKSCYIAFESDEEMTFRLWDCLRTSPCGLRICRISMPPMFGKPSII